MQVDCDRLNGAEKGADQTEVNIRGWVERRKQEHRPAPPGTLAFRDFGS